MLNKREKAIFKFGASDTMLRHRGATHLIMWEVIREYNKSGYKELDLGRTESGNEGLRRYKLSFNATESIIYRDIFDIKNKRLIPAKFKVAGFHNKAFNKMPVSLLKIIGKITYRHFG